LLFILRSVFFYVLQSSFPSCHFKEVDPFCHCEGGSPEESQNLAVYYRGILRCAQDDRGMPVIGDSSPSAGAWQGICSK